jgi:hypothetical protein
MEAPKKQNRALVYAGRAIQAAIFVAINYVIFFITPRFFFIHTGLLTAEIEAAISSYFLMIASLTILHLLLKDHIIGLASAVGLAIVEALYLYVITNGGVLTLSYGGYTLTLTFKPLLYLMMALPLVNMVKQIVEYIGRSSAQHIEMVEVEGW